MMGDRVSVELLRELIALDPETGHLTWKTREPCHFKIGGHAAAWNALWAGTPAISCLDNNGYLVGTVKGLRVKAHRVVWALSHGVWPDGEIDHINGEKADNRVSNLRDVGRVDNGRNLPRRRTTKSGVTGVFPRDGKWQAHIKVNHSMIRLGTFPTKEEAVSARKEAEARYGFHENHGRSPTPEVPP